MNEAKWIIVPRITKYEKDIIFCSNCKKSALYELDEDESLLRSLSPYCPHCGYIIVNVEMRSKSESI